MFDIGFWELVLISIVALVVLGPERLPGAIRSISRTINGVKRMANSVKDELAHELKIQELQDNLRNVEKQGLNSLAPELQESVDKLKAAAQDIHQPYVKADKPQENSAPLEKKSLDTE